MIPNQGIFAGVLRLRFSLFVFSSNSVNLTGFKGQKNMDTLANNPIKRFKKWEIYSEKLIITLAKKKTVSRIQESLQEFLEFSLARKTKIICAH